MKKTVVITATVDGDKEMTAGHYVMSALEVGLDGGPQEDYGVTDVRIDSVGEILESPEWADATDQAKGFSDAQREDFYDRLGIAAREIAERITEDAAQESDQ